MDKQLIQRLHQQFESYTREKEGTEYWLARDLQKLLEYTEWRNFTKVIEKAMISCENTGQKKANHFVPIKRKVTGGAGIPRQIGDIMLTRFACYLIAQNGDPEKESIAFAQSYFALQTRKQELLEQYIEQIERVNARRKLSTTETEFSKTLFERGVNEEGFAIVRSKGDAALFGGYATQDMKDKLNVPAKRPLADFLPTITIKAKDLATEITNFNTKKNHLFGENPITNEHVKNNEDVRELLGKSGIKPEDLPPEEDIQKIERHLKKEERQSLKYLKRLGKEEDDKDLGGLFG